MGRKAIPAHMHVIDGSKSHRSNDELEKRQETEEAMGFKDDALKAPTWLRKDAKKYFNKLVKEFDDTKILKNIDMNALALYADALLDYITFTDTIDEEGYQIEHTNKAGETNRVPHPLLTKKAQAFQQMSKLMGEFGLTASARASLAIHLTPKDEEKDDNPFSGKV